ncbi:MAG: hypothetical protein U0694_04610 [Anaerolineae bacterium]
MLLAVAAPLVAAQVLCDPYIAPDDYVTFGNTALRRGDYDTARLAYTCAIQLDETTLEARKQMVLLLLKRGDVEAALAMARALSGHPSIIDS